MFLSHFLILTLSDYIGRITLKTCSGEQANLATVYGAYSYDVSVSINGGEPEYQFSPTSVSSNRWDCQWPLDGWAYSVSVRARCGNIQVGPYTSTLSADATPQLADPPQNINVEPTADGFTVTWDPPTGPNDGTYIYGCNY
jgi:hypothetical protein